MKLKKIISLAIFLSAAFFSFADDIQEQTEIQQENASTSETTISSDLKVTAININGLKRTKNSYIQTKLKGFTDKTVGEFDVHALETALQVENLFDDIKISFQQTSPEEASVEVSVKEKITFIPLPFITVSGSDLLAGAIILDTNAFGVKDSFMVGGFVSSHSKLGFAGYSKAPAEEGWRPGFSLLISPSKSEPEFYDLENELYYKYGATTFACSVSVSEKILKYNTFSLSGSYRYFSSKQIKDYVKPDSLKAGTAGIHWNYSKSDWNGWFLSTKDLSITFEEVFSTVSTWNNTQNYSASFGLQQPVIPRLRFYTRASGYFNKKSHAGWYKKQSAASVTILPENFYSSRLCGANAGLEAAVVKGKIGTLSVYSDYQVVCVQDYDEKYEFMHGPNGGFRVYLAKIAFPALSMGLAYNVPKSFWHFSASLGVSF